MNYKKDILEKRLNDFLSSDSFNKEMDDDDLHCEVFNSQDFISDLNEAIEFLGNKTFDILDFVRTYEMDKFGVLNQVYPYGSENDFGDAIIGEYDEGELMKASLGIYIDPIKLLNMYAYIIGEEIIEDYFEKRNRYLRSEKLGDYISAIQGI